MGFFKGKPKDKDKDDKGSSGKDSRTRRSIRTIAPSGPKTASRDRDDAKPNGRTATVTRPSAPATSRVTAPNPPPTPQRPAPAPQVRPATRAPIHTSKPADFTGDIASGRRTTGPARSGDAALLEFLQTKVSLLNEEQIQQVKALANQDALPIDGAIVQLGFLTEEQMVNALIHECWVPHLKVDRYEIRKKALDTISREDAVHYGVFPVDKLGQLLTLAMVNPLDSDTIRTLESKTSLDIKKVVATRSEIQSVIDKYYSGSVQAKEGSLSITQDVEPKSVTQMLAGVTAASDKLPHAKTSMPRPSPVPAAMPSEIADIDDLLSADETIAPAIVEPISLKAEDIELVTEAPAAPKDAPLSISDFELEDTSAIALPSAASHAAVTASPEPSPVLPELTEPVPAPAAAAEDSALGFDFEELLPPAAKTPAAPSRPSPLAPEFENDSNPVVETSIIRPKKTAAPILPPSRPAPAPAPSPAAPSPPAAAARPPVSTSAPTRSPAAPSAPARPAAPAPAPPPSPAKPATSRFTSRANAVKPGLINLVPVMEEEFQHAITHGKSHVFEKWVGLQTRNRIINAVIVENELDGLLAKLYANPLPV